jgi:hypothetical protein
MIRGDGSHLKGLPAIGEAASVIRGSSTATAPFLPTRDASRYSDYFPALRPISPV